MNLQEWELLAAAAAHQLAEAREERQVSRIDEIRAAMRRYEAELLQLERFGDGARFVDGDVIKFTKTYTADEVRSPGTYIYAAVKTPRGWYVTGATFRKNTYSYDELIELITRSPGSTDVQVAASWISIDEVGETVKANADQFVSPTVVGDPMAGFVSPTTVDEKLRAKWPSDAAPLRAKGKFLVKPEYGQVSDESEIK